MKRLTAASILLLAFVILWGCTPDENTTKKLTSVRLLNFKTVYYLDEEFDPSPLRLQLFYDDKSCGEIEVEAEMFTVPVNTAVAGNGGAVLVYRDFTLLLSYTVKT